MTFDELYQAMEHEKNLLEDFFLNYTVLDKKIFLFGAGICGKIYLKIFGRHQIKIEGIVDNFKDSLEDFSVLRLSDVLERYDRDNCVFVITAPRAIKEIEIQLLESFDKTQIFSFAATQCFFEENEIKKTRRFFMSQRERVHTIYELLCDTFSKKVLIQFILGRVTSNYDCFAKIRTEDFYYPPDIIYFGSEEVMVELGSNNGDTLLDFIARCPNFKRAYCFEPDEASIQLLQKAAEPYSEKIQIIKKAAWEKKEQTSPFSA